MSTVLAYLLITTGDNYFINPPIIYKSIPVHGNRKNINNNQAILAYLVSAVIEPLTMPAIADDECVVGGPLGSGGG